MVCIEKIKDGQSYIFTYNNEDWVKIDEEEGSWEYQGGDDEESYISGGFLTENNVVIDYDGCFDLPVAVRKSLSMLYEMDV